MWLGTKEEMIEANISDEYGDVVIVEANDKHPIAWQTTWALFWGTKFYKDDTCWVMGIDQVPLSKMFINLVKDLKDTDYAMLISDAYLPHHWTKTASPSSYHIAKGSTFTEVYSFEESFIKETDKLVNSGVDAFWEDTEGRWGIDESYSCYKLREAKDTNIVGFNTFNVLVERRIECERHKETPYSIEKLNAVGIVRVTYVGHLQIIQNI